MIRFPGKTVTEEKNWWYVLAKYGIPASMLAMMKMRSLQREYALIPISRPYLDYGIAFGKHTNFFIIQEKQSLSIIKEP